MIESSKYREAASHFRIGRDRSQCHLVLEDTTVSRLHVELFFKPDYQRFYLKNLQSNNPPKIDGGVLISGEVALNLGSTIELGTLRLTVGNISQVNLNPSLPSATVPKLPPLSPRLGRSPMQVSPASYGLECPHCHMFASEQMRHSSCMKCGHFLADAESLLIPPSR